MKERIDHNLTVTEKISKFASLWEERAILYFCISNIDYLYSTCSVLETSDFIDPEHQTLYFLLNMLQKNGVNKFDLSLIINEANKLGILDSIGGADYVRTISSMDVSKENYKNILNTIIENSTRYKLFNKLSDCCSDIVSSKTINMEDMIAGLETDILDLSTLRSLSKEPVDLSEGLADEIELLRHGKIDMCGISTGYPILDRQIDGLVPGTLTVVAARKKMGKSTLLLNIGLHIAYKHRIPTLYVDTEMGKKEVTYRTLAILTGLPERVIKHGGYTDEEYSKITKAIEYMGSGLFFHERMPGYSVEKLVALYKKFKIKHNIGFAVFDYLKEPSSQSTDKFRKEYQILGDVTTKLKDLAGILDIPFLTAVQLNRDHDIADSDRIARFADVVMQWTNRTAEERQNEGALGGAYKLLIQDSRRGGTTSDKGISYHFFRSRLTIREVALEHQPVNYTKEEVFDDYDAQTTE